MGPGYRIHPMKYLLAVIVFTLAGCTPDVPGVPTKFRESPRFLVAGQSNAVSPAQEHAPYWSQTGRVTVTDVYHGKALRIPTQAKPMDGSIAWIYLGDMIDRDVTFVNIAVGNKSTQRWMENDLRNSMLSALFKYRFDAVLWVQGESDWVEKFDEERTYANMKALIHASRVMQPSIKWFIALNSFKTDPRENRVRNAQRRIIAEGLALKGPDTDTLRDNPKWVEAGYGEFVGDGLREHGRLWFEVLKPYL